MPVDRIDVRMFTELAHNVDRLQSLRHNLRRKRHIGRDEYAQAEWKSKTDRQNPNPQTSETQSLGQTCSSCQEQLRFLAANRYNRHDRNTGRNGGADVALSAVEVDDVRASSRPVCVIIPAWKHQNHRTGL